MKNFKLILVTCLCVFLFTISCDKEIISNNATPNLIQARSNAAAKLRTDIDKNFLSFDFGKYKVAPLWDLAVVFKNKKSIEVPYTVDNKLMIPSVSKTLKGRQRLLLTLSGSKVSVMIMQYIPDLTFDGKIKEINAENFFEKKFSGKIVFQSLGEEKLYIWNLEKGKIKSKVKGFIGKKRTLKVAEFRLVEVCQPYDVFYEDHETHELVYSYTEYDNCWWEDQWFDEEEDDDEDEDDGSDDDPTDCNLHPEMPWCDGEGGGGGFGSTSSDWGSDFTYSVKDQCGGFSGMWLRQFAESKEMLGFLTSSGQVIIAPSNGNTYDNSTLANFYNNENGNRILNFYNDAGTWKVELYSSSGVVGSYDITGIVHTHPYPMGIGSTNSPSPLDLGVASSYPQLNHYVLTTTGKIHYDQNGAISNDGRSCY